MPLIIFLIFIFVWYFPVYRKQGKEGRLPKKTLPLAILSGAIPAFLAIILVQIVMGWLLKALSLPDIPRIAFDSFINAALVEELIKFFTAYLIIKKVNTQRKVDYILIFGAVGMGYEITETLLGLDSVLAGVLRGILALHIIWQFWMGMYYFEYRKAKEEKDAVGARKNLILSFAVPILMHGLNDFLAFATEISAEKVDMTNLQNLTDPANLSPSETAFLTWFGILLIFIVVEIVYQIITFKKAKKASKESWLAELEAEKISEEPPVRNE